MSIPHGPRLEVITGCMFAGKSTELLRRARRLKAAQNVVLMINHRGDDRYGRGNEVVTHAGSRYRCVAVHKLCEVETQDYDAVLVDETQFFDPLDVMGFYHRVVRTQHKMLVCSGLVATFSRDPFQAMVQLVPLADSIDVLTAVCQACHRRSATCSVRRPQTDSGRDSPVLVGGSNEYWAACALCYSRAEYATGRRGVAVPKDALDE